MSPRTEHNRKYPESSVRTSTARSPGIRLIGSAVTIARGIGTPVIESVTKPAIAAEPGAGCSAMHHPASSVSSDGTARMAFAVTPPLRFTWRGGALTPSSCRRGWKNETQYCPSGTSRSRNRPLSSVVPRALVPMTATRAPTRGVIAVLSNTKPASAAVGWSCPDTADPAHAMAATAKPATRSAVRVLSAARVLSDLLLMCVTQIPRTSLHL